MNKYQHIYLSNVVKSNLTPPYDDREIRKLIWEVFGIQIDNETLAELKNTITHCPTCGG